MTVDSSKPKAHCQHLPELGEYANPEHQRPYIKANFTEENFKGSLWMKYATLVNPNTSLMAKGSIMMSSAALLVATMHQASGKSSLSLRKCSYFVTGVAVLCLINAIFLRSRAETPPDAANLDQERRDGANICAPCISIQEPIWYKNKLEMEHVSNLIIRSFSILLATFALYSVNSNSLALKTISWVAVGSALLGGALCYLADNSQANIETVASNCSNRIKDRIQEVFPEE